VGRVATAPVQEIGRTAAMDAHARARRLDTMWSGGLHMGSWLRLSERAGRVVTTCASDRAHSSHGCTGVSAQVGHDVIGWTVSLIVAVFWCETTG